jgi:hypothetical protein
VYVLRVRRKPSRWRQSLVREVVNIWVVGEPRDQDRVEFAEGLPSGFAAGK